MGKKRSRNDEFEGEEMEYDSVEPGGGRPPKKNPAEWLIASPKINGFVDSYLPQPLEALADECFNEARLREMLGAYPVGRGDIDVYPLYIEELASKGFTFSLSVTGEMCMFVNRVIKKSGFTQPIDDEDDGDYTSEEMDDDDDAL